MADKYVDPDNGDDDTGAGTWDDPYETTQKAIDNTTGGDTVWLTGTEVLDVVLDVSAVSTSDTTFWQMRGWDGLTEGGEGIGGLDANGAIAYIWGGTLPQYVQLYMLDMYSATGTMVTTAYYWRIYDCVFHDVSGYALDTGRYADICGCEFYNCNGTYVLYGRDSYSMYERNLFHDNDNVTATIYSPQRNSLWRQNIVDYSTGGGGAAIYVAADIVYADGNTLIGNGEGTGYGILLSSAADGVFITNNIFVNWLAGVQHESGSNCRFVAGNQFHDCVVNHGGTPSIDIETQNYDKDPQFVNLAQFNYRPRNPVLSFPASIRGTAGQPWNHIAGAIATRGQSDDRPNLLLP
jgi:hypothetical protein